MHCNLFHSATCWLAHNSCADIHYLIPASEHADAVREALTDQSGLFLSNLFTMMTPATASALAVEAGMSIASCVLCRLSCVLRRVPRRRMTGILAACNCYRSAAVGFVRRQCGAVSQDRYARGCGAAAAASLYCPTSRCPGHCHAAPASHCSGYGVP